jgi:hypothetical protein
MKTALLTILMMTTVSGMAFAADKSVPKASDVNSPTYAVQSMICSKIYVPATGNQSPTYHAGIDAQGNAVAPADLNPSAGTPVPDYVEVPMTIDLAKRMGITQPGAEMQMPVANLKLYKDGKVEYNGQDISSNASTMCGVGKKSAVQPAQPSSQSSSRAAQQTSGNFAPHPSSNPNYVSPPVAKNMTAPAMVEPAAGQDQMLAVPSTTVNPDPKNNYQSDSVAPDNVEPQAGSVAASATSTPPPRTPIQIQRSTVNMGARTTH